MKKALNIAIICLAAIGMTACSSRKPTVKKAVRYESQSVAKERARLSKEFGVRLTASDNLRLYDECSRWLGVKYKYGGNTKNGVDCSGFVSNIYRKVYGITTKRTAADILGKDCAPVKRDNLREGDLVFFRTTSSKRASHVGIYLKSGKFVHASSSKGVAVNSLSESYYLRAWMTGGRVRKRR